MEGAGWDKKNACLVEASPMKLAIPIPTIHFKPTEAKKKNNKGLNICFRFDKGQNLLLDI